jgi:hypothetical protein
MYVACGICEKQAKMCPKFFFVFDLGVRLPLKIKPSSWRKKNTPKKVDEEEEFSV